MTPTWRQWLSSQSRRNDSVGLLARYWFEEVCVNQKLDFETWLNTLKNDPKWQGIVSIASDQYQKSVDCLRQGKISPTYRRAFASPEHDKLMRESAAYHRQHPEVSADIHLFQKHLGLAKAIEGRSLIYLDTCHWINLRHVLLKSILTLPVYAKILNLIDQLACDNRILFPISFPLFLELLKQTDEKTRLATARLMDGLSGGVCFQFPPEIQRIELRQQCLRGLFREKAPDVTNEVWTKVGHICGELLPFVNSLPEEDMCFMQKLWADSMWANIAGTLILNASIRGKYAASHANQNLPQPQIQMLSGIALINYHSPKCCNEIKAQAGLFGERIRKDCARGLGRISKSPRCWWAAQTYS